VGIFDYYRPEEARFCPTCGQPLVEWQGKDGSRALFTWEEGIAYPTDQGGDDDVKLLAEDRMKYRLPTRFLIYSYDCENHHPIDVECEAPDGTWCKTKVMPFEPRKF